MKLHFHLPLILGFALVTGCEKPKKTENVDPTNTTPPLVTKHQRDDTPADRKTKLRSELATAEKIELTELRAKAIAEVAWNAIEQEPEVALAALGQLGTDNPERIRLIQHHAMRLTEQDPQAALEWAATLGSEVETAAAKAWIALTMAEKEPEKAANLLSESGIEGHEFDVAVVQVLQRWAQKSPTDAAAWVVKFPAGQSREAGIKAVVASWMDTDTQAAFAWAAALTDETLRAEAEKGLEEIIMDKPEAAREAALLHASPQLRDRIQKLMEAER